MCATEFQHDSEWLLDIPGSEIQGILADADRQIYRRLVHRSDCRDPEHFVRKMVHRQIRRIGYESKF